MEDLIDDEMLELMLHTPTPEEIEKYPLIYVRMKCEGCDTDLPMGLLHNGLCDICAAEKNDEE
jgi:hypothetical protein